MQPGNQPGLIAPCFHSSCHTRRLAPFARRLQRHASAVALRRGRNGARPQSCRARARRKVDSTALSAGALLLLCCFALLPPLCARALNFAAEIRAKSIARRFDEIHASDICRRLRNPRCHSAFNSSTAHCRPIDATTQPSTSSAPKRN